MAKMTVKEHDLINFSMSADVGSRRYYDKEVLCKDGNLIVNLDGNDISLNEVYHIEVVETARTCSEPPKEDEINKSEEIIKGLQCCTRDGCDDCPFRRYKCTCRTDLMFAVLKYIKETKEDNERLKEEVKLAFDIKETISGIGNKTDELLSENEKLLKENAELKKQVDELKTVKASYVKEIIEKTEKTTAKEILTDLWKERNGIGRLMIFEEHLIELAKRRGVEVE